MEVSDLQCVRSLVVAWDWNSRQTGLSINGIYVCGIKNGWSMFCLLIQGSNDNIFHSASCGLAWFLGSTSRPPTTSDPSLQHPNEHKNNPRSHSLTGLDCQVPNSEPSMVAVGMTYTDLSWTWVQSPIRQVEVETGPNLRDWEMGISGSFKENWGAVMWKKMGARQQKQLIFIATGLYWL